ncbi:MAG: hypothetical protein GF398_01420 [Chitinivibrionales bacterium]|nr:hypothetical protein [Chitinivibrionales bacterium]
MALSGEEIQRKILHLIFGIVIPGGIFYIPGWVSNTSFGPAFLPERMYPIIILALFQVFFAVVEIGRFRIPWLNRLFNSLFGYMLRKEETSNKATGATWIVAASLICSIVFYHRSHIAAMVLALFIWGDAVAALVGISIGRIKIGKKSLEGSIACFVCCMAMFVALFPNAPGLLDAWNGTIPVVLMIVGSLLITVQELFPIKLGSFEVNDNLSVPVITGLVLWGLYPVVSG